MRDLTDLGVEVLHDELQDRSYLRFVPVEPLDEIVDGCALRKVAEKGRHGPLAGSALQSHRGMRAKGRTATPASFNWSERSSTS